MDAPPGTSCPFIQTVSAADYIILVAEPTPFGLSDLRQSVETLRTMHKAFGVIINRTGLGNDDIRAYITSENINLLMSIPFERAIATTYSRGELYAASDSRMEKSFYELFLNINTLNKHGNSGHQR
ncbi:MAG: CobQ/CobB/MinD/ParA nucleotide binding domain protein [Bacteroidetes bacterium ADurb.Bin408]|nr:MAG: CobQ/CobB/MinD/ParA nucleotide binding domain protein [Bacteroidetes bacterium ADurb.Bin408]